jgi:hypothetical protein
MQLLNENTPDRLEASPFAGSEPPLDAKQGQAYTLCKLNITKIFSTNTGF